jgi:hypothetical protein
VAEIIRGHCKSRHPLEQWCCFQLNATKKLSAFCRALKTGWGLSRQDGAGENGVIPAKAGIYVYKEAQAKKSAGRRK